jgi:hypothetical protein
MWRVFSITSTAAVRWPPLADQQALATMAFGSRPGPAAGPAVFDRVEAEDAVQRVVAVVGMQGGDHQVAGLGIGQCCRHGFAVADFADHDAVGAWRMELRSAV